MMRASLVRNLMLGALLLCVTVGFLGCTERSNVRPVEGTITLNGKPLTNAYVSFQPVVGKITPDAPEGMGSYGRTDEAGKFSLKLVDTDQPGAIIGVHAVRISITQPGMADDEISTADNALPVAFRDGTTTFEVQAEGENRADFSLKKGK